VLLSEILANATKKDTDPLYQFSSAIDDTMSAGTPWKHFLTILF
jgi:hypothetical protein